MWSLPGSKQLSSLFLCRSRPNRVRGIPIREPGVRGLDAKDAVERRWYSYGTGWTSIRDPLD
jgi:hypothetical protein